MPTPLATAIRSIRTSLGWTQPQLAGLLGVHVNAVTRWENGKGRPAKGTHARLLTALEKVDPVGSKTLAAALLEAFPPKRRKGQPAPSAPAPTPAPSPVYPKSVWVDQAIFRMADHLDLSPRVARGGARRFLQKLSAGQVSVDEALAALAKGTSDEPDEPDKPGM
jgi:transcriptional regulator with XRE-family HTH domain